MKTLLFKLFRRFAKSISGHGLREKSKLIDRVFQIFNKGLSPNVTQILDHKMFLDAGDSMGLSVHGIYEPEETRLIQSLVRPGAAILDLGANIGYYTLLLARAAGPDGKVFAFEPHPVLFELLEKNIKLNGYKNVVLFPNAVSDHPGKLKLFVDNFYNLDHRIYPSETHTTGIDIEAVTVDSLLAKVPGIDLIKMDIQGAELLALRGMQQLIRRSEHVTMMTEFWPDGLAMIGCSAGEYFHELAQLGFTIFNIEGAGGREIPVDLGSLLQRYPLSSNKHTNLLCIRSRFNGAST